MNKLVSVIIPVYNVEDYLKRCINSVIEQTYKELEIILVDDGSTDNSPAICDSFAAIDSRIIVFHTSNNGAAAARNVGLDSANGDYIMFCDSDDIVSEYWVERMIEPFSKSEDVIPFCKECNSVDELNTEYSIEGFENGVFYEKKHLAVALNFGLLMNAAFIKKNIDKLNLRVREQKEKRDYNDDLTFLLSYFKTINYFVETGHYDYAYIYHEGSLSKSYNPYLFEKYEEKYRLFSEFYIECGYEDQVAVLSDRLSYYFMMVMQEQIFDKNNTLVARCRRFKSMLESESVQNCFRLSKNNNENPKVIEMICNKESFRLWMLLSISRWKNSLFRKTNR